MITILRISMRNIYKEYKEYRDTYPSQSPIQLYDCEYDFLLYLL